MERLFKHDCEGAYDMCKSYLCASMGNIVIPLDAFFRGEHVNDKLTLYHAVNANIPFSEPAWHRAERNYISAFKKIAGSGTTSLKKKIRGQEEYRKYFILSNAVYDADMKPLMLVCLYNKYAQRVRIQSNLTYDALDKTMFCVVVDKKMYKEEHTDFYRNFNKLYLEQCREQGIDILETSSIDKLCYNVVNVNLPNFQSIEEEEAYLQTVSSLIYDDDNTRRRRPAVRAVRPVREPDPMAGLNLTEPLF